jgi:hypothetical protein
MALTSEPMEVKIYNQSKAFEFLGMRGKAQLRIVAENTL